MSETSTPAAEQPQGAPVLTEEEELRQARADVYGEAVDAEAAEDPKDKKNKLPEIPISERATITCQEDLDKVLAAHKRWVIDTLDPNVEVAGGRANLAGADLRGYSLREANLSGANLSGADLTGVDLTSATLTAANLTNAMLACAVLCGVKLRGAKLEGANLRGADLTGANLAGVDLSKCIMKGPEKEERTPEPVPADAAAPAEGASAAEPAAIAPAAEPTAEPGRQGASAKVVPLEDTPAEPQAHAKVVPLEEPRPLEGATAAGEPGADHLRAGAEKADWTDDDEAKDAPAPEADEPEVVAAPPADAPLAAHDSDRSNRDESTATEGA